MTYRMTELERRARRRQRRVDPLRVEADTLAWEMRLVKEDFARAAELYARKLERLSGRAAKIVAAQRDLKARLDVVAAQEPV